MSHHAPPDVHVYKICTLITVVTLTLPPPSRKLRLGSLVMYFISHSPEKRCHVLGNWLFLQGKKLDTGPMSTSHGMREEVPQILLSGSSVMYRSDGKKTLVWN